MARETWDIFCRVVDNFGDVGIAWRLARQVAADDRRAVRLVVDGIDALARIEPSIDVSCAVQEVERVEVLRATDFTSDRVADVVVELLGCGLPDVYLDAMEARTSPSVWIDFEHLSAEAWVDGFHGKPSPHPSRRLTKHFFYPGFGERTGGLWFDFRDVGRRVPLDASHGDALMARIGVPAMPEARRMSLFTYPGAPVRDLFDVLARDPVQRWSVLVPDGILAEAIDRWFGHPGRSRARAALTVTTIPFVAQDDYDRLLAHCDVNFVRGEDSFVRAQAAGRPFAWHVYPQAGGAHLAKLAAFEARYGAHCEPAARRAQRAFWQAWNDPQVDVGGAAVAWLRALPQLATAATAWRSRMLAEAPLVERLATFVAARRPAP